MESIYLFLVALSTLSWALFALIPWRPWSNREVFDATNDNDGAAILKQITVVIPARNEAEVIQQTLHSVIEQGSGLSVVLVDDHSEDRTVEKVVQMGISNLRLIRSRPLPNGWSGKLWALEQGRRQVTTPYTLLLDADIRLAPGTVESLGQKMVQQGVPFISLMAVPAMSGRWEKLLMPAFVYFFKILYPFQRVNLYRASVAAAAGGCILVESGLLTHIGGFESIKSAVIDDCTLAQRIKSQGFGIWLGLTHSVQSGRRPQRLAEIWDMVARTAFAQLQYSMGLLALCTAVMLVVYLIPTFAVFSSNSLIRSLSLASLGIMFLTYIPILRFYHRSLAWGLGLPLIAALFLAMTWTSAISYWRGERTRWKGRIYQRRDRAMQFSKQNSTSSEL